MTDRGSLLREGFTGRGDGTLRAPNSTVVKLIPVDEECFELRLLLRNGAELRAVIPQSALQLHPGNHGGP
jgi:hypothetical protein